MNIIMLTIIAISSLKVSAQNDSSKVYGCVSNEQGERLPYVSIIIKTANHTFTTATDEQGLYNITLQTNADSASITFRLMGYDMKTMHTALNEKTMCDAVLGTSPGVLLDNITVGGRSLTMHDDHVTIIPTKRQQNGANSGIGLLSNIMIPQLDVNRITGEVKSDDGTGVTLYIDGRKADKNEVEALRPKDILKIEFYDRPNNKFPNEYMNKVVNYVMRQYEYGGFIDIRTDTRWLYQGGDYKAQTSIDHKNMNYTIAAGTGFAKDKKAYSSGEETYMLQPAFMKKTVPADGMTKQNSRYALLRSAYHTDSVSLYIQAGMTSNNTPVLRHNILTDYIPSVYLPAMASNISSSKSLKPNLEIYFSKEKNNNSIDATIRYDYTRNSYHRTYTEGTNTALPITSDTHENTHEVLIQANYNRTLRHNNSVGVGILGFFNKSNTDYDGTIAVVQDIEAGGLQILPSYSQTFAGKLNLFIQAGVYAERYRVNDNKAMTKLLPRPMIAVNYRVNNRSNISMFGAIGTNEPQMELYNETEQQVNGYELMRGNPELDIVKMYFGNIRYNLYLNRFNLSVFASYNGFTDMTKELYFPENNIMVHTYVTDGTYNNISTGLNAAAYFVGKKLQLKYTLSHDAQIVTGMYSARLHYINNKISATYLTDKLSVAAYFTPKQKSLDMFPIATKEERDDYGMTVSYGDKGWFAEIGCRRIFNKSAFCTTNINYGNYSAYMRNYSNDYGRLVYLKLSYNFDFGRKTAHETIEVDTSVKSAVMKP